MPSAYSSTDPYIGIKQLKKKGGNIGSYIKMLSKRILVSLPLILSILSSYALADPLNPQIVQRAALPEAAPNAETFQKLLNEVDPPALHSLLHEHSPKKFAHGMFREDRVAVEAIHRENPPLAESIVSMAKRQAVNNGTTQSSPASPAAPSTASDGLNPSASNPNQISNTARVTPLASPAVSLISSTTSAPDSAIATTATTAPAPSSAAPSVTQSPTKTSSSAAGQGSTITNSFGVLVVTTIGGSSRTVASVSSTQGSSPKISATTTIPARTSVAVFTSTLSNGSQSLVTQTTVFGASVLGSTPTGTAGVRESSTLTPSLQPGAAARTGSAMKAVLCLFGGALGLAMLM